MNLATNILTLRDIKNALCAKLKAASFPLVGDNVFVNRSEKFWPEEGVLLCVYTQQSSFDNQDNLPEIYKVETDVVIEVIVQSAQSYDGVELDVSDVFDLVSSNVVDLLTSYPRPKWLIENKVAASDFLLKSFSDEINGDGETDKGARKITFTATWYFEPITSDLELNDLQQIHTEISFNNKPDVLVDSSRERIVTDAGLMIRAQLINHGEKFKPMSFDTNLR